MMLYSSRSIPLVFDLNGVSLIGSVRSEFVWMDGRR